MGEGARTIELSPSGRFVFAECNLASKLYVVDTRNMRTVDTISVDSYPVGLDISNDGRFVIVTSQGRGHEGGNAVNIYEAKYAEPEPVLKNTDGAAVLNRTPQDDTDQNVRAEASPLPSIVDGPYKWGYWAAGLVGAIVLLSVWTTFRRRKMQHHK